MKPKPITAIIFLLISFSNCGIIGDKRMITWLDYPKELENKIDTIEVTYIAWACACANWLPTTFLNDPNYYENDYSKDCIFLEADKKELVIPDEYHLGGNDNQIKLIGTFYKDQGISRGYIKPTSEKPDKAKVF